MTAPTPQRWKPHVTVAALAQQGDTFLLVEEETREGRRYNQPAGHLEQGESLLQAVVRECLEETRYHFRPTHLVGIYQWPRPDGEVTYLRFAFAGEVTGHAAERPLDAGIIAPHWLSLDELRARQTLHRSPLVLRCVEDLLAGRSLPLEALVHYG